MNLHVAQKDFSVSYLFAVRDWIWLFCVSTGYMFFFPNKCSIYSCSLWYVSSGCYWMCSFLMSCVLQFSCWYRGMYSRCVWRWQKRIPRTVGVWMWAHPRSALQGLASRSVWQPTPRCSPHCPGEPSRSKPPVLHSHVRGLGVPWVRLGVTPVLGRLQQLTEQLTCPWAEGLLLLEQHESTDRFLAVWQHVLCGGKSMWWWSVR